MDRQKLKETLRISGRTIGISLLIYAVILIFRLHYAGIILLLTGLVLITHARKLYNNYRARSVYIDLAKALLHTYLIVTIIYVLSWILGPYGFWGSLLIIFLIAAYKILRNWQDFIKGLRDIETEIWGRPLDRREWQDRKPPKLRLVLKKRQRPTGENMKNTNTNLRKPLHPVACWVSIIAFALIGAGAIVDNIITALFALYAGIGAWAFTGYLVATLLIVCLAYLMPIYMMVTYLRHARRVYAK